MLTTGINHVAILTEDVDRFCAFYADVFGATVVFAETTPAFRHAILSVGGDGVLHPVEVADNPHGRASAAMLDRGHLDHFALNVPSQEAFDELRRRVRDRGASDGVVTDLGPKLSFWFTTRTAPTSRSTGCATRRSRASTPRWKFSTHY
jgi:catechol 2,3-dioxygenase-like lactoylglutathione lyase family enzyme